MFRTLPKNCTVEMDWLKNAMLRPNRSFGDEILSLRRETEGPRKFLINQRVEDKPVSNWHDLVIEHCDLKDELYDFNMSGTSTSTRKNDKEVQVGNIKKRRKKQKKKHESPCTLCTKETPAAPRPIQWQITREVWNFSQKFELSCRGKMCFTLFIQAFKIFKVYFVFYIFEFNL